MKEKRSVYAFKVALCELLSKRQIGDIRVIDLCARSGYSRSVFYENYYDKYELAESVIEDEIALICSFSNKGEWLSECDGAANDDALVRNATRTLFKHILQRQTIYRCIFTDVLRKGSISYMADRLREWDEENAIIRYDLGLDHTSYPSFFLRSWLIQVLSIAAFWAENDFDIGADELSDFYLGLMHGYTLVQEGTRDGRPVVCFRRRSHSSTR